MKRLTPSMRRWLQHRRRSEMAKRTQSCRQTVPAAVAIRNDARLEFRAIRSALPPLRFSYDVLPKHAAFAPPEIFSFTRSYGETLAFIMDFQRLFHERKVHRAPKGKRKIHYADFGRIQQIDAGAGLVLAAEIDRFAKFWGKPTRVYDHLWQDSVRDYFLEAGLFELLGIDPYVIRTQGAPGDDKRTLKFVAGHARSGDDALGLLERIEQLTSRALAARPAAYAAVAEALANVQHAYPKGFRCWPALGANHWWASGFWSPTSKTVGLQLYDHGAGIPATLPKQTHYPWILKFLDPEGSPAGLISAALEYGRTSTGQPGRGKGLAEMAEWIERTGTGFLRILSGAGQVTYRPGGSVEKRNHDVPFRGTLVEWEISLGD